MPGYNHPAAADRALRKQPMPPDLMNMFAVPFAFSRYPDAPRLNSALRAFLLALERAGGADNPRPLTYRNDALFESHFNLFRDPDPAVQELKRFCWDQLLAVIGRLNGYDLPTLERLQIYNDCWFHVTRRGGYFGLHNHPNASWSGVYCVDPGRHDPNKKMSGALSFVNPMITSAMHMDAGIARLQLPYAHHVANLNLEPGQLVIFPSWVLHDVKPFEGEGERITIAFNCWFTLPDAPATK
ncbi:MAG: putative 2OG-Fe(II) oxygenase [Steroidobacteraceae bacterium]